MLDQLTTTCLTEDELLALAGKMAKVVKPDTIIYLNGELGAGKTTFTRGFIHALGYQGKVKSPTYTLVESYEFAEHNIIHIDLYRINDPQELELAGIREYFTSPAISLIEWADKGEGHLPAPDIICEIEFAPVGRTVTFFAKTAKGDDIIRHCEL